MKMIRKFKILLFFLAAALMLLIVKSKFMKNIYCKTENGYELVGYGGKPVDVTNKIRIENCECLNEIVLDNPSPKRFNSSQLELLRKELPKWAEKNVADFSKEDHDKLLKELQLSDVQFLEKLKYKFSYFGKPAGQEIPIYSFPIKSTIAYCPNYIDEYALYGKKDKFGFEIFQKDDQPDYSLIEDEEWALKEFSLK